MIESHQDKSVNQKIIVIFNLALQTSFTLYFCESALLRTFPHRNTPSIDENNTKHHCATALKCHTDKLLYTESRDVLKTKYNE